MFVDNIKTDGTQGVQMEGGGIIDMKALQGYLFEAACLGMPEDARQEYLESAEVQQAVNEGSVSRKSIMFLNKQDDLTRRVKLACLAKAKEENSNEWQQLRKVQAKRKELLSKIAVKYTPRVQQNAIKAQRAMLKVTPNAFTRPIRFD